MPSVSIHGAPAGGRRQGSSQTLQEAAYCWLVSGVAAIAGLLFGFDIAVINGAIVFLRAQFHLNDFQTEMAVSFLLMGCIAGAAIAGWLADRYGRRRVLSISALLFGVSSLAAALPRTFAEFGAARMIGGVAIGIASTVAPLYIAEVAPAHIRGRLVSLNQIAIVTGILLAYFTNWVLSFSGAASWRWMFAVAVAPALALFAGLFLAPESPRWLMEKGREGDARAVLERTEGVEEGQAQVERIRETLHHQAGTLAELFTPALRRPLYLIMALAVLQQITGINTVLFYGSLLWEREFRSHGHSSAIGMNTMIGLVNFAVTLLALWLIERSGRRALLMFSSGSMAICQLLVGLVFRMRTPPAFFMLGSILLCVAAFAVGLGPVTWTLMAELLPTNVRGKAMSIANMALWIASCVLTFTFLSLVQAITATGAFCLYGFLCGLTFVLVWKLVPETKGRTLEEIEEFWRKAQG